MDIEEKNEVSLLDLLVVVAENLKLLILGPLAAGLLALGIGFSMPQSYVSQAILALKAPAQAASMMVSPIVLDPVIESLKLSKGLSIEVVRKALAKDVKAAVGKDGLLLLEVTASTPIEAQTIANALIDSWLKSTVPSADERAEMEKRLAFAKSALDSTARLEEALIVKGGAGLNNLHPPGTDFLIAAIGELETRYRSEVLDIPRSLQGLSRGVVKQPPTLPTEPASPKKGMIATLTALAAGFALLLWVFMRQAWRKASLDPDPQVALKLARLRAALSWRI
jgi:Chain length determinant protein